MPCCLNILRRTTLTALAFITLTLHGTVAHARTGWEPITVPASGQGTAVCNNGPENFICFGLRCKAGEKPEFVIFFTGGLFTQPVQTKILIDAHPSYSLTFRPIKENGELGAIFRTEDFALLKQLKDGSRMTLVMPHTSHPFSLRRSSKNIEQAENICGLDRVTATKNSAPPSSENQQAKTNLAAAVDRIVKDEIAEGCETGRGTIADAGLTFKDLDNDGKEDMILSHHAISCPHDHIKNSIFCGAQVCTTKIFLRRNIDFKYEIEFLGFVDKISQDAPPLLSLISHGGKTAKIRWNGKKIAVVK